MNHAEFAIGQTFWCGGQAWRCTDIGTRTVTAIRLDRDDDSSWYDGPPYAVAETVFGEDDQAGCSLEPSSPAERAAAKHAVPNALRRLRERIAARGVSFSWEELKAYRDMGKR